MPKYDKSQENYYTFIQSWCLNDIVIPVTNTNLEKTGQILELMNAESHYTLVPAYYDKSLNGKFTRDEESSEMFDINFANKVISLDEMYGWGMAGAISDTINSGNFASAFEKNIPKVQKNIDKTVMAIQTMG
jgi:hypothetical protein